MICPACKTQLPDHANFCFHCGRRVRTTPTVSEAEYQKLIADFENTIQIQSNSEIDETVASSQGDATYVIKLAVQSCTCPDWRNRRTQYPIGHIRRLCKHIVAAMLRHGDHTPFDRAILAHVHFGIKPTEHFTHFSAGANPQIFAVRHQDKEWCDIIALTESHHDFDRLGYNFDQRRWAYGEAPIDSNGVERKLLDWRSATGSLESAFATAGQ